MRILRREGYTVIGASNGREGLDELRRSHADLVLLDVMMPEMDGITMLDAMRKLPALRELPVILLSALSDETRMQKARELGACEYLVKTRFSYDELLDHVNRYVKH